MCCSTVQPHTQVECTLKGTISAHSMVTRPFPLCANNASTYHDSILVTSYGWFTSKWLLRMTNKVVDKQGCCTNLHIFLQHTAAMVSETVGHSLPDHHPAALDLNNNTPCTGCHTQ
jgi:hypothetical protein